MASPLLLVTGFEPFLKVRENPSGQLVQGFLAEPPPGLRVTGGVLPVSIERLPAAFDALLESAQETPAAFVSLGVQRKAYFRLERRARAALSSDQPDNDGRVAAGTILDGPPDRGTTLDLEHLAGALRDAGAADVRISDDAGGYVCERAYYHVLARAQERGVPGLFLHLPPLEELALELQRPIVTGLLRAVSGGL